MDGSSGRLNSYSGGGERPSFGFEFYKVVAAATMYVMSHLFITYMTSGAMNLHAWEGLSISCPVCSELCFVTGFILLKISVMTGLSLLRTHRRPRGRSLYFTSAIAFMK